jgi:hypothetical protein
VLQMRRSFSAATFTYVLVTLATAEQCLCAPGPHADSPPDFRELLQKIASFPPDPCGPPNGAVQNSSELESSAFDRAADIVTEGLNTARATPQSSVERATETLNKLVRMSAEVNSSWPEEDRFRFEILKLPPVIVVKMGLRNHELFFAFGNSEGKSGNANQIWHNASSVDGTPEDNWLHSRLGLYPLHRGPSQHARFLAIFGYVGCAGSTGIAYSAYEWNPEGNGDLEQIIKQAGAFGLDTKVPGFAQIGKLRTEGSLITLPYCWFSPIDTWDNPSLCAVDSYDLSDDDARFRSHAYNRPDLVPVAKVLEYAERRDYLAVLGYCASSGVARMLVREIPPFAFADDLRVTRTGIGKESVELGLGYAYRFEVEKRAGRWLVVSFRAQ